MNHKIFDLNSLVWNKNHYDIKNLLCEPQRIYKCCEVNIHHSWRYPFPTHNMKSPTHHSLQTTILYRMIPLNSQSLMQHSISVEMYCIIELCFGILYREQTIKYTAVYLRNNGCNIIKYGIQKLKAPYSNKKTSDYATHKTLVSGCPNGINLKIPSKWK